jgi:hypothetical protein
MTDFLSPTKRRAMSERVAAERTTMATIKPFMPRFEEWNHRAAKASATAMSPLSSLNETAEQKRILASLCREIEEAYEHFESAIAGSPSHGRIDDLRAAFCRLLQVLDPWRE